MSLIAPLSPYLKNRCIGGDLNPINLTNQNSIVPWLLTVWGDEELMLFTKGKGLLDNKRVSYFYFLVHSFSLGIFNFSFLCPHMNITTQ